jgi:Tfp pilus assembly protein FimT
MIRRQTGLTVAELLVVIAIIGVMGMIALPDLNRQTVDLPVSAQELSANMRLARAYANGRGAHYRVTIVSAQSYKVERLQDNDNDKIWMPDSIYPAKIITFPPSIRVVQGIGTVVEFNTRGIIEGAPDGTPAAKVTIKLHSSRNNSDKTLEIWPSGQIFEV